MNYEAIILLSIACLGFYIKIKYGIIITSFWLMSILFNFFFTTFGMNVILEEFPESDLFYISKKGNYNDLYQYLKEFHIIQKKFKLPYTYRPFGIFYDNPAKNKNKLDKLRSIIGIIKKRDDEKIENKKKEKEFNDEEFKKYMKSNNYKSITLSKCKCVIGDYESIISLMNCFVFIAKIFISNINQKFFTRLYNPEWKDSNIKNARRNCNKK